MLNLTKCLSRPKQATIKQGCKNREYRETTSNPERRKVSQVGNNETQRRQKNWQNDNVDTGNIGYFFANVMVHDCPDYGMRQNH